MRERVCKNCGGRSYTVVGQNMVKCKFCGTLYVDEYASKEEEVLTVGAYEKLRDCNFSEAVDDFDKILSLYPLSFEGFYGKTLAKNKIVFYNNKKGTSKKARFFGETIPSILEDEDFKSAIENAPPETAKTYSDQAKRIEKIKKNYDEESSKVSYDIFVDAMEYDEETDTVLKQTIEELKENNSVFFAQETKEKEEDTFRALQTCKVFLLYANAKKGYSDGENKNLFDRYSYFLSQKKKTKNGFIIAYDDEIVSVKDLPKELSQYKNTIEMNSVSFLQDLKVKIKNEMENSVNETAKIETVKIEKVEPQKKEYIEFESINPSELGHYHIDNVELSETNKIKWIFLTLKNGDFASAEELVSAELAKDPNNAELLFAQLLCILKIKTQEDFFSNIANFRDRERIDAILEFASKGFAEYFVDGWENLVESLDSEEYYNAFLLYLAKFSSPNRDTFVSKAESKAVETLNDELIEKVLKCFKNDEVGRFVNFYFMLAQKSDNQDYYKKVLDIDEGHEQSNLALLLQHFITEEDKLTYRDRDEIENVFKYLSESTRVQFVSAVVNMVLPISFYDIDKAVEQLDFYLAYVSDDSQLISVLKIIASYFQSVGFFKQAERYIAIAISKDTNQGDLYWQLILIKLHCKTDNELVMTNVKVTQMPEWETLLSVSDENQTEKYAEIISKANLYAGEKFAPKIDLVDKVHLIEKLNDFVNRNNKILLELENQEQTNVPQSVQYYKEQMIPFENYIKAINDISTLEEYQEILEKIKARLDALELTLESSVDVIKMLNKEDGLKNVYQSESVGTSKIKDIANKETKSIRKDKFLKKFLYIFLEMFPLLFTTLLLVVSISKPKEVYMYFSQEFWILTIIFSIGVGITNMIVYINKKETMTKGWKIANVVLFAISLANLFLMSFGFYFMPNPIEIENEKELQVLLNNATYSNFVLKEDLDMSGKTWKGINFSGTFDGNGHSIKNLKFAKGSEIGFFKINNGEIRNLTLSLLNVEYSNFANYGTVATTNHGTISNCFVTGKISLNTNVDAVIGGLVGKLSGGTIENCVTNLEMQINVSCEAVSIGGIAGTVEGGKNITTIAGNINTNTTNATVNNLGIVYAGGIAGNVEYITSEKVNISRNENYIFWVYSGKSTKSYIGGLIGQERSQSKNNYVTGALNLASFTSSGYAGGLYGQYLNTNTATKVETSYSLIEYVSGVDTKIVYGSLAGKLSGVMKNCFTNSNLTLFGESGSSYAKDENCKNLPSSYYDPTLHFDEEIWLISDSNYPKLK